MILLVYKLLIRKFPLWIFPAVTKTKCMKLLLFVFFSCFLISNTALAQKGKMIKLESGISYNFMVDGEEITGKKAKKLISNDPEALYSFESARQNKTVSHIFIGLGVAGL